MISNITLVEVGDDEMQGEEAFTDNDDPSTRLIKYHLGPDFLHLSSVGLMMNFSIGPKEINNMEMCERHYFRGRVIRDYSFKFGFVMPNSTNSWEFQYELPKFTEEEK